MMLSEAIEKATPSDRIVIVNAAGQVIFRGFAANAHKKLLEIRKTRPRGNGPYTVLVYVTGGVGVVGEFVCDCFYKLDTVPGLPTWALPPQESGTPYNLERASCLTRRQLEEYAGGSGKPLWGWHISHVREYEKPLSLPEVGMKKAPQSWCYLGGAA